MHWKWKNGLYTEYTETENWEVCTKSMLFSIFSDNAEIEMQLDKQTITTGREGEANTTGKGKVKWLVNLKNSLNAKQNWKS